MIKEVGEWMIGGRGEAEERERERVERLGMAHNNTPGNEKY